MRCFLKSNNHTLYYLLKADLLRQQSLIHGDSHPLSCRIWFGLLSPRFIPVLLYRLAYQLRLKRLGFLSHFFTMLNVMVFGIEITPKCTIGPGLFLPHTQGTVIGAISIGDNVVIYQGVTLGAKSLDFRYDQSYRPVIGHNVIIGSGAKVLGGISVGDNVVVGANSVLLTSVPANQTVVGIPARIIAPKNTLDVV